MCLLLIRRMGQRCCESARFTLLKAQLCGHSHARRSQPAELSAADGAVCDERHTVLSNRRPLAVRLQSHTLGAAGLGDSQINLRIVSGAVLYGMDEAVANESWQFRAVVECGMFEEKIV